MNKLHFTLINNDNIIIDKEASYIESEQKITFHIENTLYSLDLEKKIFNKKDAEKEITIEIEKQNIIINMLEIDHSFDMPIAIKKYENKKELIELMYSLEDAEKTTNVINIKRDII